VDACSIRNAVHISPDIFDVSYTAQLIGYNKIGFFVIPLCSGYSALLLDLMSCQSLIKAAPFSKFS